MNSTREFPFEKNSLIITSSGAKSRGWLDYLNIKDFQIFDSVEPNPSMETVEKIGQLAYTLLFKLARHICTASALEKDSLPAIYFVRA